MHAPRASYVKAEALLNGTEKVLDHYFTENTKRLPSKGDKMRLTITTEESVDYDTKIVWLYPDEVLPDSNYYLDVYAEMKLWLCPFLQVLFKSVPEILYVNIDA